MEEINGVQREEKRDNVQLYMRNRSNTEYKL